MASGQRECWKKIAIRQGKNIPIDFWPLWALIEAVILPFQGNSSPSDIRQQAEHLLHEHELDDEVLQKAQLEQHKIFQNFPTNPALVLQALLPCLRAQIPKSLGISISHTVFEKKKRKKEKKRKKLKEHIIILPDRMKHKLESRLLRETAITSDMQMTPPLWQKVNRKYTAS